MLENNLVIKDIGRKIILYIYLYNIWGCNLMSIHKKEKLLGIYFLIKINTVINTTYIPDMTEKMTKYVI
jgi:hypothetical protein